MDAKAPAVAGGGAAGRWWGTAIPAISPSTRRRDRSSAVRYGDSEERRAHLDRVVDRLQREDEQRRYRELSDLVDELVTKGEVVSPEIRAEYETLVAKLKR